MLICLCRFDDDSYYFAAVLLRFSLSLFDPFTSSSLIMRLFRIDFDSSVFHWFWFLQFYGCFVSISIRVFGIDFDSHNYTAVSHRFWFEWLYYCLASISTLIIWPNDERAPKTLPNIHGVSHVPAPRLTSTSTCQRCWLNFSTVPQGRFFVENHPAKFSLRGPWGNPLLRCTQCAGEGGGSCNHILSARENKIWQ